MDNLASDFIVDGVLQSPLDPTKDFGLTYYAYMIPPKRPENALFLGFGRGTVKSLIELVHGKFDHVPVDLDALDFNSYGDAIKFVAINQDLKFDYICVDLWYGGEVEQRIYDKSFVKNLYNIATRFVCVNSPVDEIAKMGIYKDVGFKFKRAISIEGNIVTWWERDV